jgi:hypothetical protein
MMTPRRHLKIPNVKFAKLLRGATAALRVQY